jgi:hypothetical protein
MMSGRRRHKPLAGAPGLYAPARCGDAAQPGKERMADMINATKRLGAGLGARCPILPADTAARPTFTEYLGEKQGETPHVHVQGSEYDWPVKPAGKSKFAMHHIMPGAQPPEGWMD